MEVELGKVKFAGLAIGILGLVALVFFLPAEKHLRISQLSEDMAESIVVVSGKIGKLSIVSGNAFFELTDGASVHIAFFNPTTQQLSFLRNDALVTVTGKLGVYKGSLQIVAEKVVGID